MVSLVLRKLQRELPERIWIPLFILNESENITTKLKFQKLVFLIQNKAKIRKGYDYRKYYYGPYSSELDLDTCTLDSKKLIRMEKISGRKYPYWNFWIQDHGREVANVLIDNLSKTLVNRVKECVHEFIPMNHNEITEYVYSKFWLTDEKKLNEHIKDSLQTLKGVTACYEGVYFPECPFIVDALAFSEYCNHAITKAKDLADDVQKSIVVNSCNELIFKLLEIGKLCAEEKMCFAKAERKICKNPDPSLFEIFNFIEDYCVKKDILPSLHDFGFRMMSGEDLERLKDAFANLDLDSY